MGKTVAERLGFLISSLGITQAEFARRVDFTQAYISMILNGTKTRPSSRFFEAVSREFRVDGGWLKDGLGEVFITGDSGIPGMDAEILAKYRLLPPAEKLMVDEIINAFLVKTMSESPASKGKSGGSEV